MNRELYIPDIFNRRLFLRPGIILGTLFLFFVPVDRLFSQPVKPEVSVDFSTWFDNREYDGNDGWSQTLTGLRLTPQVGISYDKVHKLMLGTDLRTDFGTRPFEQKPGLIAYYNYDGERLKAFAGVFPRRELAGSPSRVVFSDSIDHYDSNLQGFLLLWSGQKGFVQLSLDWYSMVGKERREKFMVFSSGHLELGRGFFAGYNAMMHHHAGSLRETGVVDYLLTYPYAGYDFATGSRNPLCLSITAGWIQTFQNDRKYIGRYVTPGGFQSGITVSKWGAGLGNTLYAGRNLMPYYQRYGSGLYTGDPFYDRLSGIYNRTELFWHPVRNRVLDIKISMVAHYNGIEWGFQQLAVFSFRLESDSFLKFRRP